MRIIEKGILDLTPRELRQCKSLSLRSEGLMCEDLRDWREYEQSRRGQRYKRKCRVIMLKQDDETLIAWALVLPRYRARGYEAQFYTRKSERGKGYASVLMGRVQEIDPRPYVYPHDNTSGDFFKKHRDTIRFDNYDARWLK